MKKTLPILFTLATLSAHAADWPQWRGPNATGAVADASPPLKWSETQNVKWKVKIPGSGSATPIVLGDKIFVITAVPGPKPEAPATPAAPGAGPAPKQAALKPGDVPWSRPERWEGAGPLGEFLPIQAPAPQAGQTPPAAPGGQAQPPPPGADRPGGDRPGGRRRGFGPGGPGGPGGGFGRSEKPSTPHKFTVMAIDRKTGKTLWEKVAREQVPHEGHHGDGTFASGSPVTDGQHLYVSFGSFGIFCYDLDGNLKWEKDLGDMRTRNAFGEGTSPALHGDTLVINWDHEGEDFIVALDKKTGQERWRKQRDEATTWSTPLIVEHEGKAQVIVTATNKVRSYDLKTGDQIWECGGMTGNVIPTPVSGFGMVYAISGFRGAALLAIKLDAKGAIDGTDAIAWKHNKSTPYVPSPVLAGERLYFLANNNNLLSCFNAKTGQPIYEATRISELGSGVYASPVAAADRIYIIGRNGSAAVIKAGDTFEVLASNKLDDRIDASPAIVGKEMFLRGNQHLYCIAE
jgi:outer membrane protein assembly factor BamB